MNCVGIVIKEETEEMLQRISVLTDFLKKRNVLFIVMPSQEDGIKKQIRERISHCDLCITFGGDGTFLFAARIFSPYKVPIVGINLGGLGFITEFRESEVLECIECVLNGDFDYEERMMIDTKLLRDGYSLYRAIGLNDTVISSGGISRLIQVEVSTGKTLIGEYRADGVIVATPTGSTAYSLSAGGPILEPTMKAFVISPICPHTLGARPLVIPAEETIRLRVTSKDREVTATVDGQIAIDLEYGDEIVVKRSKTVSRLVSLGKRSFFDIVREKLSWKG